MDLQALVDISLPEAVRFYGISQLSLDSRLVAKGCLFFAVRGLHSNGEDFIDAALAAGAVVIVRESVSGKDSVSVKDQVVYLELVDLNERMGQIASKFYGEPSKKLNIVGITGTNGKTSCADLLVQSWRELGFSAASIGTLGWSTKAGEYHCIGMTTPDALQLQKILARFVENGIDYVAMEVSSHAIAQKRIAAIHFDQRVLTNISRDHLDYHGDMQTYAAIKKSFVSCNTNGSIINADDEQLLDLLPHISAFSLSNKAAEFSLLAASFSLQGMSARFQLASHQLEFKTSLMGYFNLANLLVVFAVLYKQGTTLSRLASLAEKLQAVPGRLQRVSLQPAVYIDFAHTPDALENVLRSLKEHCQAKLILVFGCGGDRDQGKRSLMGGVAERLADSVLLTSDNPRSEEPLTIVKDVLSGIQDESRFIVELDRRKAIQAALQQASNDDLVLVAGKGHEQYQEIQGEKISFNDAVVVKELLQC
ncbi:UDP-N-acetylmuramoyl-L-alanyl-D-glutamate--2,6-diaminopimelate ligase [Agaribacterium sp. ZY112]|uniref:UDP-N-acetylmuramoyl-L-alanyl-D-glutamate--2, 6-diaminopimelate ligase n=1 Tax=Agaribacterium sp. ZY112 TaxID=3233574 RepID=UPI003526B85F